MGTIQSEDIEAFTAKVIEKLPADSSFRNLRVTSMTAEVIVVTITTTATTTEGEELNDSHQHACHARASCHGSDRCILDGFPVSGGWRFLHLVAEIHPQTGQFPGGVAVAAQ